MAAEARGGAVPSQGHGELQMPANARGEAAQMGTTASRMTSSAPTRVPDLCSLHRWQFLPQMKQPGLGHMRLTIVAAPGLNSTRPLTFARLNGCRLDGRPLRSGYALSPWRGLAGGCSAPGCAWGMGSPSWRSLTRVLPSQLQTVCSPDALVALLLLVMRPGGKMMSVAVGPSATKRGRASQGIGIGMGISV